MFTSASQANKRKVFIEVIILLAVLIAATLLFYSWYTSQRTYPHRSDYPFISIHELKQLHPTSGLYNTEGYIVKISSCPLCPAGAVCKPCMGDNIVISEQKKTLETYILTDTELIIFVNHPKQFTLGMKYTYTIQINQNNSTGENLNDAELVGYNP